MQTLWQGLLANLSIIALCTALWCLAIGWLARLPKVARNIALGLLVGCGTVAAMSLSFEVRPGIYFDLRSALIASVALFASPLSAAIGVVLAAGYRLAIGGDGVVAGVSGLILSVGLGTLVRFMTFRRPISQGHVVALAALVGAMTLIVLSRLPQALALGSFWQMATPLAIMNVAATLLVGLTIRHAMASHRDRYLLFTALLQAPDYQYIKNRSGQFIAVNRAVARHHGFSRTRDMLGLTDRDLYAAERADRLMAQEEDILVSGTQVAQLEEEMIDAAGEHHWYSTSKVALRDADGEIIGIAGVSRDITDQRKLAAQLTESRDMLSHALTEMSDGLALFGRDGILKLCNDQYRELFPLTQEVRRPGIHIRDILAAVVAVGEQLQVGGDPRAWIDAVAAGLKTAGCEEVALCDGRHLTVRTKPTSAGDTLVIVTDVTEARLSQSALHQLNAELSRLAATDGLTKLANRRAFDEVLAREVDRSERAGSVLSVLMIDVDRFKAFNDHYGHLAGDACLATLAQCLRETVKRATDLVARFGGEEFAVILPETDAARASFIAETFLARLAARGMIHEASPTGLVSASVGVASYHQHDTGRSVEQLLARADGALYAAKLAGRAQVMVAPAGPVRGTRLLA